MPVSDILALLSQLFGPETQACVRTSGFCQRRSKLTGQAFVQGLVFGWLQNPQARVCDLAYTVGCAGSSISPQALQQRFNSRSAAFLQEVIARALHLDLVGYRPMKHKPGDEAKSLPNPVLPGAFSHVWLQDSTVIALPEECSPSWRGGSGKAALKVQVRFDVQSGALAAPLLVPGCWHDLKAAQEHPEPKPEELHIADLGYFDLKRLNLIDHSQAFFLSRLKAGTIVTLEQEKEKAGKKARPKTLSRLSNRLAQVSSEIKQVDWAVRLGTQETVSCRLLAVRVPPEVEAQRRIALQKEAQRKRQNLSSERVALCGWTVLVTNAPAHRLDLASALALYGARWQIERLFRLWKETLGLTHWRSANPDRILCEVYAKLLAAWVTQSLLQRNLWHQPQRSLTKAARGMAAHASLLLAALAKPTTIAPILEKGFRALAKTALTQKKNKKPATFQKLCNPKLCLA